MDDGRSPVVGNVIKAWIDEKGLWVIIEFARTELADGYWELYRTKFQRAFSVGMIVRDSKQETKNGKMITIITEVELLEISCVPVPANPEALSRSAKRKAAFVAGKKGQGKESDEDVIELYRRKSLYDDANETERQALCFSDNEITRFSEIEDDACEWAEEMLADDAAKEEEYRRNARLNEIGREHISNSDIRETVLKKFVQAMTDNPDDLENRLAQILRSVGLKSHWQTEELTRDLLDLAGKYDAGPKAVHSELLKSLSGNRY